MKNLFLLAILVLAPKGAEAHFHQLHCLVDIWDLQSTQNTLAPDCELAHPLELVQSEAFYPKMGRTWPVRIWQGTYSRKVTVTESYLHTVYDQCNGKVVTQTPVMDTSGKEIDFSVENPNLSEEIGTTYELAPLTDIEAKTEFASQLSKCRQFTEPKSP
jgi:hypothetical protein